MKINLGCGKWVLDGWFNVDVAISPSAKRPPELLCDVRAIPLPDECADELMGIHIWEHIDRWDCETTIIEWRRLLKPNGLLVLEMPDLLKCCSNILKGREGKHPDQLGMWGIFGDPTTKNHRMMHRWSWTYSTLKPFLAVHGFNEIREEATQFHASGGRGVRDFRIEARKRPNA